MARTWIKMSNEIHFHPDIIANGFSKKQRKKVDEFRKVWLLRKRRLSIAKIAKALNIPEPRVFGWVCERKRPPAINAIEAAKRKGWLPISTKNEKFVTILDVFTWIFGDGSLKVRRRVFLSGQRIDLEKIGSKISEHLGLECEITEDPGPKGKNSSPDTCRLTIKGKDSCTFGRLLIALGAPEGNKVKKNFLLPDWIFHLEPKLRKGFLEVFLSNEISIGNLEPNGNLPNIKVTMHKLKEKSQNLIDFLNQIGSLLETFDIKVSKAKILDEIMESGEMRCIVILRMSKSMANIFKISKTFKLRFAEEKQRRLDVLQNITRNRIKRHMTNIENFEKAMKLRESSLGCKRVARILKLKRGCVNGWFHSGTKPRLFNQKDPFKKLDIYLTE